MKTANKIYDTAEKIIAAMGIQNDLAYPRYKTTVLSAKDAKKIHLDLRTIQNLAFNVTYPMQAQMLLLVQFVREQIDANNDKINCHQDVCIATANEFDLWDNDNAFPIWLCRVVEGEMRDKGIGNDERSQNPYG